MLRLNDDCLYHIFRTLSLREQLIVAAVCRRFRDVIVDFIWHTHYRVLATNSELTNRFTADEYEQFFILNAVNLEKLTITDTKLWAFTSYLGRFYRPELVFYFNFAFPALVELHCLDPRLHDAYVQLLAKKAPRLHVLQVSTNTVTGAHIRDLQQLRQLYMPKSGLSTKNLQEILAHLPLTHLDIRDNTAPLNVGEALSTLRSCALRELSISESAINEQFVAHFHKLLPSLKMLHVNNLGHVPNDNWSTVLQLIAPRTHTLHLYNTASYTSFVPLLTAQINALHKVQKLHLYAQTGIVNVQEFWQLSSLQELHLAVPTTDLPPAQQLLRHCSRLEHIYLSHFTHTLFSLINWISSLLSFLNAQRIVRPLLTVHVTNEPKMHEVYNYLKMTDVFQQQSVLRFEATSNEASEIVVDQTFVKFELE